MRVLIGCEESQVICEAFINAGHDAMSCDLNYPGAKGLPHYQGDVRDLFGEKFDLFIVHPECTRLCNSGVRWLAERNLWDDMRQAAEFFRECLNAPFPKIAAENPIPHKYALEIIGRKYDQVIHPSMFGHMEQKATCLWLKNLEPLTATNDVYKEMMKLPKSERERVHYMSPGPERRKLRSRTLPGVGQAMAAQWTVGCTGFEPVTRKPIDERKA